MKKFFLVTHAPGEGWVAGKSRTEQHGWREHAAFMNDLAERGFVVLGRPISDTEALLAIDAENEELIRKIFADDPWQKNKVLTISEIRAWTILLEQGVEHKT